MPIERSEPIRIRGHLWQNFSSVTFKQLPSPGPLVLENPFDVTKKITYPIPQGGGGYYRTPSLDQHVGNRAVLS